MVSKNKNNTNKVSLILTFAAGLHYLLNYLVFGAFDLVTLVAYLAVAWILGVVFSKASGLGYFMIIGFGFSVLFNVVAAQLTGVMLSSPGVIVTGVQQALLVFVSYKLLGGDKK